MMSVRGGSVAGYRTPAVPVIYAGPGDVVSGAVGWWGLRAYSLLSIGINAIRLRRSSDNAEQNFVTVAGGGLDMTAINTFRGAASLFVVKLYDQSGNSRDMLQATAANQPAFTLNILGSSNTLPIMQGNGSTFGLQTAFSWATGSQPYSFSHVAKSKTTEVGFLSQISDKASFDINVARFVGTPNSQQLSAPTGVNFSFLADAWHRTQIVLNAASSTIMVDAASVSVNPGANNFNAAASVSLLSGVNPGGGEFGNYDCVEYGVWIGDFTAQRSALDSNQQAYWAI